MNTRLIHITVNGDRYQVAVAAGTSLVEVLREHLGLTGTKRGCTSGSCGVCTINDEHGRAVLSCIALAVEWDGRSLTTIEGVERDGSLDGLQQAFWEHGAVQCGFCTPGLVMSARALLQQNPGADAEAINEALAGAICRCTGHIKVKKAVASAVQSLAADGGDAERGREHADGRKD